MKIVVTLPLVRETPGTVVYALKDVGSEPVGQIYIRKTALEMTNREWPPSVTVTVEVNK